jgi:cytosine permease
LFPAEVLQGMGAVDDVGKFIFCTNVLIGSAGALALVDADLGRYARSSRDIGAAAAVGNFAMCVVMVFVGGVFMYAGTSKLVAHYATTMKIDAQAAQQIAMSPDGVTAAFLLFGGSIGVALMILAQGKAQVLNTYSGSLALSNLFDAVGMRMSRTVMVVVANIIGLAMVAGGILAQVQAWIETLGVVTTAFAGVMIVDYFLVSRWLGTRSSQTPENCNWAGVITTVVAAALAHYVLNRVVPIQFFTSLTVAFVLYPCLRLTVLRPRVRAVSALAAASPAANERA